MRITGRVRQLERSVKQTPCKVCREYTLGVVYDPPLPDGGPVTIGGLACAPVPCPACGRTPPLVLTMPPPTQARG